MSKLSQRTRSARYRLRARSNRTYDARPKQNLHVLASSSMPIHSTPHCQHAFVKSPGGTILPMAKPPICDECVKAGLWKVRMAVRSLPSLPDPTYWCEGHSRIWHEAVGYQKMGNFGAPVPYPCPDPSCNAGMFIESAEARNAHFRCPNCGNEKHETL